MESLKKKNAITLIALVVTIIVLLILAGVTLSFVAGENGILKRATDAVDINEKASIVEEVQLAMTELQMQYYEEYYVDKKITQTQVEYLAEKLTQGSKTDNGTIKLEGTEITYTGSNGTITKGTFDEMTGKITMEGIIIGGIGQEPEGNRTYLYREGDKKEALTGGWEILKQQNASANLEEYDYIEMNSKNDNYCLMKLSTKNKIDITNYKKVNFDVTVISNGWQGSSVSGGFNYGISQNPITLESAFLNSPERSMEVGENMKLSLDITDYEGDYFIGMENSRFLVKVHSIWLE